jgi:hypothetical protein
MSDTSVACSKCGHDDEPCNDCASDSDRTLGSCDSVGNMSVDHSDDLEAFATNSFIDESSDNDEDDMASFKPLACMTLRSGKMLAQPSEGYSVSKSNESENSNYEDGRKHLKEVIDRYDRIINDRKHA